jgi:hypothetical protein
MVPFCLEMANNSLPGPAAMPCSVNQYKCFAHNVLLMMRVLVEYSQMLLLSTGTVSFFVPVLFLVDTSRCLHVVYLMKRVRYGIPKF